MNDPLTRGEHEEFTKNIETNIRRLEDEDKRLSKRIEKLENGNDKITELTISIQRLTDNVENMRKMQEDEGKRLTAIEGRDGVMWRKVVGYIVTAVISIV
ncbi:MAG: hypothetical protein LUC95_02790, partial [Lachnospiraceae bacterium]|nr:hypothetical protein [Lachnospiraceae bacterium]